MLKPSNAAIRRRIAQMIAVADSTPYKAERRTALRLARRLAAKHGLSTPSADARAPVDPVLLHVAGAIVLRRDHSRFRTVDLASVLRWLITNGYLVQLTVPGPYEGRYLIGPGEWPICKEYSDGHTTRGRMVTKRPAPRKANHWYLLPHPDKNDVRIRDSYRLNSFAVHWVLSSLDVPTLAKLPAHIHREYGPELHRADRPLLELHFPSQEQQRLYRRLAGEEATLKKYGEIELGTCTFIMRKDTGRLGDRYAYLPCGAPAGDSGYCAAHAHWPTLLQTIGAPRLLGSVATPALPAGPQTGSR